MSAPRSLKRARRMCSRNSYFFLPPFVLMLRQEKRDPCHSVRSVTKVSSEHMTSGIAAVMTLPCSGLPEKSLDRRAALYSPLSFLLIPETAASVKGENAVLRKNPTVKIRRFSRLANYNCFFALNRQSTTGTSSPNSCGRKRGQTFSVMQMTEAARRLPISQDSASVLP